MSSLADNSTRFAFLTPDDRGGWIWLTTILSLTYAFLALGIRVFIKWQKYSVDDTILILAYISGLAHWSIVFSALKYGLGKSSNLLTDTQESKISELLRASRILLFITLGLSKCCILLLIRLLFTELRRVTWLICNISIGIVVAWGVGSALAVSIRCPVVDTGLRHAAGHCAGDAVRWKIVTAFDVMTEAAFVILCAIFVSPLQMRFQRKSLVVIAFAFRLPVAVFSIISLHSYLNNRHHPTNTGLSITTCWQEALLSYSLMSATIPCLQGFMKAFNTAGSAINMDSASRSADRGNSFALDSMKSAGNIRLRPDPVEHTTKIYSEQPSNHTPPHKHGRDDEIVDENGSTASKGSKEMIIKKTVEWGYTSS